MSINKTTLEKPLVAVLGPTGVGKSRIAAHLAQKFNGEIINADSRQVYRYMDIGTAKPSPEELALVSHHLYSIINPDEDFSLAQYQDLAYKKIKNIQRRHKIPFLVGGTGQYLWSVLEGWKIPRVPPDLTLRNSLHKDALENGIEGLYHQLQGIDPVAASKIDKRNIRRVIRALEVSIQAKAPFSTLQKKSAPDYRTLIIGLTDDRDALYQRIDSRVNSMIQQGLVAEIENLGRQGYKFDLPSMSSIGYKQIADVLKGETTMEEAVRQIKTETHRFVRHQYAWFKLRDERIYWFSVRDSVELELLALLSNFLQK